MKNFTDLRCVCCNSVALHVTTTSILCPECGTCYPVVHDVPILFSDVTVQPTRRRPSPEFAQQMGNAFSLATDAATVSLIQDIFSKDYKFADFLIDVESRQFVDRVKNSGNTLSDQAASESEIANGKNDYPVNISDQVNYQWLLDYLPREIQVATTFTGNVRLENTGTSAISSHANPPIFIAYHWRNLDGSILVHDGHRTPIPIELLPGHQLTVPMLITAPDQVGSYLLEITLVHETVCWLDKNAKIIATEIVADAPLDQVAKWHQTQLVPTSYADDHKRGIELLKERLDRLGKPQPKILEIGGNANPMIQGLTGELYNVDVDIHGLQVGVLATQRIGIEMQFICADANALPFSDNFFDAIVIFSSLHHFPDLRATMKALPKKVRPGGFIAILCEPAGHYFGDTVPSDFLDELLKGVNEQTFSLAEYADIFCGAGLESEDVIADIGSLKAFLPVTVE